MGPYRSREELNAWLKAAQEERDREIQAVITYIHSTRLKNQGRFTYDRDGNYLGFQFSSRDLIPPDPDYDTLLDPETPPPIPCDVAYDEEEEEVGEIVLASYLRFKSSGEIVDEEVNLVDSTGFLFEDEDVLSEGEDEVTKTHSWEDEFCDELLDIPSVAEEDVLFDPLGDLKILESLLNGELSVGIKVEACEYSVETEKIKAELYDIEEEEVVEEIKYQSRPDGRVDDEKPPRSQPREKARKRKLVNRNRSRSKRSHQQTRRIKLVHNNSLHYLPRIQFGPGKFKYWWPDSFKSFKLFYNSINLIFINNDKRKELNGLDKGWIKEKPLDFVLGML